MIDRLKERIRWWRVRRQYLAAGCGRIQARLLIRVAHEYARWSSLPAIDWAETIAGDIDGEPQVRDAWLADGAEAIAFNPQQETWRTSWGR